MRQALLTCLREHEAAATALEELCPEFSLQPPDQARHGRLGHVELLRGGGEGLGGCSRDEGFKLSQSHKVILWETQRHGTGLPPGSACRTMPAGPCPRGLGVAAWDFGGRITASRSSTST